MSRRIAVAILCCLFALVGAASFLVDPGASGPEPAEFDRTVSMGLTLEERQALGPGILIPRAQVAYSQYPYVVGYRGIGLAAAAVEDPFVGRQFGYVQSAYVEIAPPDVSLGDQGYPVGRATDEWIPPSDAWFVVGAARLPSGPTTLPFGDREAAETFRAEHGGEIVRWEARERFETPDADGSTARDRVDRQQDDADRTVTAARRLLDRPVETVVGEDAPTLSAALDDAEANTTVRLPPGTYDGDIVIDRPVTVRGEDATIVGDGNGTVLTVTADDVALAGISFEGVGDSIRTEDPDTDANHDEWDRSTEEAYGYADAAVTAEGGDRLLVTDVNIETPASGIILRDVERGVIDDVRVDGIDTWIDGFMGVTAIRSPAVVQRSAFTGGRDAVYTHRADGITVRENHFVDGRFGTHLMYTSDALVADNCATGQALSGVVIMTSPSGVAIANNTITDTEQGISTSGSNAYIGENTVVGTEQGIRTSATNSLYADNTVVANTVGFRASAVFPTSVVVNNDVADNDRHVRATSGPLRVWSRDDRGNYWEGAAGLERPYSPTDPIDGRLHRSDPARTLADAPVIRGLRTLRGSAPGTRSESVVDAAPRDTPANPTRLEAARALADGETTSSEVCSV